MNFHQCTVLFTSSTQPGSHSTADVTAEKEKREKERDVGLNAKALRCQPPERSPMTRPSHSSHERPSFNTSSKKLQTLLIIHWLCCLAAVSVLALVSMGQNLGDGVRSAVSEKRDSIWTEQTPSAVSGKRGWDYEALCDLDDSCPKACSNWFVLHSALEKLG